MEGLCAFKDMNHIFVFGMMLLLMAFRATASDACFDLGNYWCYNTGCIPAYLAPSMCGSSGGNIKAKCIDNAVCNNGRYSCNAGYEATWVNPGSWGNWCQYCYEANNLHQCVMTIGQPSEPRLEDNFKKFLEQSAGGKEPSNVTRKND